MTSETDIAIEIDMEMDAEGVSNSAMGIVDGLRGAGFPPNMVIEILTIALITVFKNSIHKRPLDAEEFASTIARTVKHGIIRDAEIAAARARRQ